MDELSLNDSEKLWCLTLLKCVIVTLLQDVLRSLLSAGGPYIKNPSKIFFSGWPEPKGQWPWAFGMEHWGLGPIKVSSNDDLGLTLTYFMARSNLVPYAFIWENLLESHLMEETYSKWPEWHEVYVYIKILTPGLSAPDQGQYTCGKT